MLVSGGEGEAHGEKRGSRGRRGASRARKTHSRHDGAESGIATPCKRTRLASRPAGGVTIKAKGVSHEREAGEGEEAGGGAAWRVMLEGGEEEACGSRRTECSVSGGPGREHKVEKQKAPAGRDALQVQVRVVLVWLFPGAGAQKGTYPRRPFKYLYLIMQYHPCLSLQEDTYC